MRIVAGEFRSRVLTPAQGRSDAARPPTRSKKRFFSSIGPYFSGGVMLDAYAGSGNISFEALSRGMAESVLCDISAAGDPHDPVQCRAVAGGSALPDLQADVFAMLDVFVQQGLRFDLVYIDPPYRLQRNDALLEALVTKGTAGQSRRT